MAYDQKPNTGALFKNDKRENDKHPNAKGDALIDGVAYWVSSWTNEAKDGRKYQSLKFERKDKPLREARGARGAPAYYDDLDSDIPF